MNFLIYMQIRLDGIWRCHTSMTQRPSQGTVCTELTLRYRHRDQVLTMANNTIDYVQYTPGIIISLCCVSFLANCTHILQGYFTGTGAIIWLPQCQWSNPEGYVYHRSNRKEYGLRNCMNSLRITIQVIKTKHNKTRYIYHGVRSTYRSRVDQRHMRNEGFYIMHYNSDFAHPIFL